MNIMKRKNHFQSELKQAEKLLDQVRKDRIPEDLLEWTQEAIEHSEWEIRNIAIKIAGLAHFQGLAHRICDEMLSSGNVGFIRRNAAFALGKLESEEEFIVEALIKALKDPYYEVRVQAANSLAEIGYPDEKIEELLLGMIFKKPPEKIRSYPIWFPGRIIREKNFEVRMAMTCALGTAATGDKSIHALELLLYDGFWQVREAAMKSLISAATRLGLQSKRIFSILKEMDLTSPEFRPVFPIRQTWNEMVNNSRQISERLDGEGDR
jgi:UDP-N-acetylglucosamine--N-acetylmuramyl-(pentapeptide) pyrophosphoryl-undecaprenol N-acetylglucosamine transferase